MQYGKLKEFVTLVTDGFPELLTFRQRVQLILGLRARSKVKEVEVSTDNFVELVQTLLEDPTKREPISTALGMIQRCRYWCGGYLTDWRRCCQFPALHGTDAISQEVGGTIIGEDRLVVMAGAE
ncbi:uncharacterized protein ACWYII_027048 isoform 2-T2 [Salvelinus alpinus]